MDPAPETLVSTSTAPDVPSLSLRCWGTRGSIPSPGPATAGYGGNTPCVEVRMGERRLIFDAGSGLRLLGQEWLEDRDEVDAVIFLTHFHWDHIQGFPFFTPLYRPDATLRILGPMQQNIDIRSLFAGQMGPIYFPVPFSAVSATTHFEHVGDVAWEGDGARVSALRMRHPSFTVGYRLDVGGRSICYLPDNELAGEDYPVGPGWWDQLIRFVGDADILIHDAMYTEDEYAAKRGWGHSTFRQALDLAVEAGARRLLLFHHAPERSDQELSAVVDDLRRMLPARGSDLRLDAASEGEEIAIQTGSGDRP